MTAAVAALFMKSDNVIVTIRTSASAITGCPCARESSNTCASRSAVPVEAMAVATGNKAPSSTITGQSIELYTARGGTIRNAIYASTAAANAIATGRMPRAVTVIAAANMPPASSPCPLTGTRMSRSASGTQLKSAAKPATDSGTPCINSTSPARILVERSRFIDRRPWRDTASKLIPYRVRSSISDAERPEIGEPGMTTSS